MLITFDLVSLIVHKLTLYVCGYLVMLLFLYIYKCKLFLEKKKGKKKAENAKTIDYIKQVCIVSSMMVASLEPL